MYSRISHSSYFYLLYNITIYSQQKKTCVQKTRSAVRIEGTLSSFFENKTGLKQGDSLSPILFNLAMQKVIQYIQMVPGGIKIGKEQLNVLA